MSSNERVAVLVIRITGAQCDILVKPGCQLSDPEIVYALELLKSQIFRRGAPIGSTVTGRIPGMLNPRTLERTK